MDYTDNGIGFDTNDLITKKGLGLKNIDSRVSLLNGNYKIKSNVGEGFNIAIEI
jgi:signal transduction histidine kinase